MQLSQRMGRRYRLRHRWRLFGSLAALMLLAGIAAATFAIAKNAFAAGGHRIEQNSVSAGFVVAPSPSVFTENQKASAQPTINPSRSIADDWRLTLVNKDHPLPDGYRAQMKELPNGLLFDARAYDDLMRMIEEGESQGLNFVICSAYRSVEKQRELFDAQVAVEINSGLDPDKAREVTATKVAPPGTSEHNLGLAADIVAFDYQKLDTGYCDTPEYKWLKDNAHRFGFILRYPQGKSEITGIMFEPWHFRYVGIEYAGIIRDSGLCLEEYLAQNP